MLDLLSWIKDYSQTNGAGNDFKIIPQNGERILDYDKTRFLSLIDGIGIEDLWYDETSLKTEPLDRLNILDQIISAGLDVYSIDYIDDGSTGEANIDRIKNFIGLCQDSGFTCYAAQSDRELDEENDYLARANLSPVPVPACFWLLTSALFGLTGVARHNKTKLKSTSTLYKEN